MTQTTTIGALEVELRMDTGNFVKGASATDQKIAQMSRSFITLDASLVTSMLKWAALTAAVRGIYSAFDKATEHMDSLGKTSQKVGIAVDDLSKLEYAAKLADVEMTTLGGGLKFLSKALVEVAGGDVKSDPARMLARLGVSARDAHGNVRPVLEVFNQLADKFAGFNDNAEKTTALATIFGRRFGPEMAPMMNTGAEGLKKLGDELGRVGGVVTKEAAHEAEEYRDNMTRLEAASGSLAMKFANVLLPSLVSITDEVNKQVQSSKTLMQRYNDWGDSLRASEKANTAKHVGEINALLKKIGVDGTKNPFEAYGQQSNVAAKSDKLISQYKAKAEEIEKWRANLENSGEKKKENAPVLENSEEVEARKAERLAELNEMLDRGKQLTTDQLQPLDELTKKRRDLIELLHEGVISEEQYAKASSSAAWTMASSYASAASAVAGALAGVFQKNKTLAIASAMISTFEAAAKALAAPPGPPFSYAYVAAALASGFAQVRNIQNTNKDSSGGGGGAAASTAAATPAAATPAAATQGPQSTLFVQGFSAGQFFSGDSVRQLASKLIDYQRDGGKVVLA